MKIYKKLWGLVMISFVGCQIMAQSTQLMLPKKQARSGRTSGQFGHKGEVPATQTIADVIVATPNLKKFAALLKKHHNILQVLHDKGPFTVFAPIDEAFDEYVMYTLNNLSDQEVGNVLKHHIVQGVYPQNKLAEISGTPTLYQLSTTTLGGDTLVNYAFGIAKADVKAKNGIIHTINQVLIPVQDFK